MRFFLTMLFMLLPLAAQDAPAPPRKGPPAPKNLKVLTPEDLRSGIMMTYVQSLGVAQSGGCLFCHAQGGGRDSDDNPKKLTARTMITMVKDINTKLGAEAGKPMVTCYTCHRGKNIPETAPSQ